MNPNDLNEINKLLTSLEPLSRQYEQEHLAKKMRGEVYADWLNNFISRYSPPEQARKNDPTINKETGLQHTVESMVDELANRVGLKALQKTASSLEEKEPEAAVTEMRDFLVKAYLEPTNGEASWASMVEGLKGEFDNVISVFGMENLRSFAEEVKEDFRQHRGSTYGGGEKTYAPPSATTSGTPDPSNDRMFNDALSSGRGL